MTAIKLALLAAAACGIATQAAAVAVLPPPPSTSIDRLYVRARLAAVLDDQDEAAQLLARAAEALPHDPDLARRAFTAALLAGDRTLALSGADRLAALNELPVNGALLRFGAAADRHDWRDAQAAIDQVAADRAFAFVVPVMRAWLAHASGEGKPLDLLVQADARRVPDLPVHRALLQIEGGEVEQGRTALLAAIEANSGGSALHGLRLRIAGAAALSKAGDPRGAETLLAGGSDPSLAAARAELAAGRTPSEAINSPASAVASLLARVATDLAGDRTSPVALVLARTATLMAPDDAESWLVVASVLAAGADATLALGALDHVPAGDPFALSAGQLRVSVLASTGDRATTLKDAARLAQGSSDPDVMVALGDAQAATGKLKEAADSYRRAGELARSNGSDKTSGWTYDLMAGGAYQQAGDWTQAKPLLQRAVAQAPDDATALNYLGYSSLEEHDDVVHATQLIERAHKLAPDNAAITDSLGWAYFLTGRVGEAVAMLEHAAQAEPADPTINEHLGDAYWAVGRRYEARYAWRAASVAADPGDAARLAAKIAAGPAGTAAHS